MSSITPAGTDPQEIEDVLWSDYAPANLAFDIGANCGQSFDHMLRISETIVAFEPSWEAYGWIESHNQNPRITTHMTAISSFNGEIELYALPDKIGTGQLVSDVKNMEWSVPGKSFARTVSAITLDKAVTLYGVPDFVKVDVEGHEGQVFMGAERTLHLFRPDFLVEVHDADIGYSIKDALDDADYTWKMVRHPHYAVGSPLWHNHYWIKAFA